MGVCSRLLLITIGLQILGITIPYLITLRKSVFSPSLPFISQTVATSLECGIFSFLLVPASFSGFTVCIIIHALSKFQEKCFLSTVEHVSFLFSLLYFLSWMLICAAPLTFTDLPNKYEWVLTVLSLHMIGALLMLASIVVVTIAQAILLWKTPKSDGNCIYRRNLIFITGPVTCIGLVVLVGVGFEELGSKSNQSMQNIVYVLPTKLSCNYCATTICEWILISCMWIFLISFYKDLCVTDLRITVKRKTS